MLLNIHLRGALSGIRSIFRSTSKRPQRDGALPGDQRGADDESSPTINHLFIGHSSSTTGRFGLDQTSVHFLRAPSALWSVRGQPQILHPAHHAASLARDGPSSGGATRPIADNHRTTRVSRRPCSRLAIRASRCRYLKPRSGSAAARAPSAARSRGPPQSESAATSLGSRTGARSASVLTRASGRALTPRPRAPRRR